MPNIVLRHSSDSDRLIAAVESLGYELERKWAPGDRYLKSRTHETYGFNLCLVSDRDESLLTECLEEALYELDDLNEGLTSAGHSLQGCSMDIGVFGDPDTFCRSVKLTAGQCAYLGKLGVNFETSFYAPSTSQA
jgi:hypothetical protein